MKILHVIPSFDPALGGPPRIAVRLAAGAAALGHAVTIASYDSSPEVQRSIQQDHSQVPSADRLRIELLGIPNRFERLTALRAGKVLKRLIPQFDVVQTHDVWSAISRRAMRVAADLKVPFVLLPNGMFDPWSMRQKAWKKNLMLGLGYRNLLNRALFFHTGNVDEKAGVEQVGLTAPIEIVPNGVYPQEFENLPARGEFYAAHPELGSKPYVLFLSRLHYKKGLDYLADSFAKVSSQHPDLQLVVAGPDDGAEESFRQAIESAGLKQKVHMVGPIFSQDRFKAIVDSVCFCLPSRQEGFSIAILEALACGRPVVITDACHFPEVASNGAGEVVGLDVQEITDALNRVVSDPDRADHMGRRGRELVMRDYTWPVISARLVDAYQNHLAQNFKLSAG